MAQGIKKIRKAKPLIHSKLPQVRTSIFAQMSNLACKHGAINLSQGSPNFDCSQALKDRVNYHLQEGKNQYAPMSGVPILRERISQKAQSLYDCRIDSNSEITVTAGATQGLFTAILAFVRKGDEVLLFEPAFDSYRPAIELAGGIPVAYELRAPDYQIDWEQVQQLVSDNTRMIIINTPHNPTGITLKAADMAALEQLTLGTDILVLSDEVYEHILFDGQRHESILRYPNLLQRGLAIYSFGKTFHNTGWKIGYCIAPDYLMKEFRKVHQFNIFNVNSFVQYGLADYLEDPQNYLTLPAFYQHKRDFFVKAMAGSSFRPLAPEGAYFQLFDYSEISKEPDVDFARRLTIEFGVSAIPISVFYSSGLDEHRIRFCFAKTEDLLEKAAQLLNKL